MVSLSLPISSVVFACLLLPSALGIHHGEQNVSTLLYRLNALETEVATLKRLKNEVAVLTTELQSQKELIMSLEALVVTRSRFLAGDECLFTFANDTGTPTCSIGYQVIAESGLEVKGSANFARAQFKGSVIVEDTVEFLDNVTFQRDANVVFNGRTGFSNRTFFNDRSTFNSDVRFRDEASFYDDVSFLDGSEVAFEDKVVFFGDVTIDGPQSGQILFDIKDGVEVKFRPSVDMIVETATTFYEDVELVQKPCPPRPGKGSSSCSNTVPSLLVAGDISCESGVIVEGELQVDEIAPFDGDGVLVNGDLVANAFSAASVDVSGDIVAAGLIKGASLESTSTIRAAGDITSTGGFVSPVDLTGKDVTVNSLTAVSRIVSQGFISATTNITVSGIIKASGDITTDGNFVDTTL